MLNKLAFKNVGKSFRDYAIYFFTLTLGVCIFYMFNSIDAQSKLMSVTKTTNESMQALRMILSNISVFVAIVLGFLIVYANNYFIKRRKKEFGIYLTLGMEKNKISVILILETAVLALTALAAGLLLGIFLSQFMSLFTAKLFEADMTAYRFVVSSNAIFKSILFFGVIFAVVIIFNMITIRKYKLIDLIYGSRKNESTKSKHLSVSIICFLLAIISLIAAYVLILKNGIININIYFFSSLALGTLGTVLFFFSFTDIVIRLMQKNKKLYYKGLNLFIVRQLSNKINTNFISMSVVCIVLLLTIGTFACGYSVQDIISKDLKNSVPYDISIISTDLESKNRIIDRFPKNLQLEEYISTYGEYSDYTANIHFLDLLPEFDKGEDSPNFEIPFITLSDYNKMLQMQQLDPVTLPSGTYGVLLTNSVAEEAADKIVNNNASITLSDTVLHPSKQILKNPISIVYSMGINLVVDDSFVNKMRLSSITANIICNENTMNTINDKLTQYLDNTDNEEWPGFVMTRSEIYASTISTKALVSFLSLYLSFVFIITSAAILAIQQLSEASDNKDRYELLHKLGNDRKMMNKALFKQISCYFFLPLMLAIIHSIIGLISANNVIKLFGKMNVTGSIFATAGFIVLIYGAYFILTYLSSKRIINKS